MFKKKRVIGKSGIAHEIDVVEIDGKEYIFADLNEKFENVLSKLLIAMDSNMPLYLQADKPIPFELKTLLYNVEVRIGTRAERVVRESLDVIYERISTAKWYLKLKGVEKNLTREALVLLSDFYGSQVVEDEVLDVLSDLLIDVPDVINTSFLCELVKKYGCPKCGSLDVSITLLPDRPIIRCLRCGFTLK